MAESSPSTQWNYYQILGKRLPAYQINMDDITAIQFDKRGQYLATGDRGGSVVIFERDADRKIEASSRHKSLEELDSAPEQRPKFRFKTEYQSHDSKFDPLSNELVSPRINKVSWCVAEKGWLMLLSANDKKIKLWTIKEYELGGSEQAIPLGHPRFLSSENVLISKKSSERGQEASCSSNGGHLEWTENLFQEEYRPPEENDDNDEFQSRRNATIGDTETEERITSAEFHPVNCNLLAYGSSRGCISISDMRQALRCDNSARFLDPSLSDLNHPFEKRASHISDVKFLADDGNGGQQFISRDHMNMKLWDMRMDYHPIETFGVHEELCPRMAEMYDYGLMSGQFDCCSRRDGFCFASGSFSHRLKIFSMTSVEDIKLDVIGNIARQGMPNLPRGMPILPRGTVRRSPIRDYIRHAVLDQGGGDINDDFIFGRIHAVACCLASNNQYDYITAIQFEKRGHYLATGDEGGRVVIFERDDRKNVTSYRHKFLEELDSTPDQRPKFRFKTEFQSHEFELSKTAISERINKVSWCVAENGFLLLLSANTKKIKLWTIKEYKSDESEQVVPVGPPRFLSSENVLMSKMSSEENDANGGHLEWTENLFQEDPVDEEVGSFGIKKFLCTGNTFHATCKKVYAREDNSTDINSISNNSDGQTFISADECKINLWNLDVTDSSVNLVEMKPSETSEMITSAVFHPIHCNLLAYGSSRGRIHLSDMRQEMRCDSSATIFHDPSLLDLNLPHLQRASWIYDVKFLADDGIGGDLQLISRDYMNMKIWDMRMDAHPIAIYGVHEQLRPRMAEIYDYNLMTSQFDCCSRSDGLCFATGSYSHRLKIFSTANESVEDIKLDVIANIASHGMPNLPNGTVRRSPITDYIGTAGLDQGGDIDNDLIFGRDSKLLRVAWLPTTNLVASAVKSNLIFYHV
ncbi:hypothetical protein K1719_030412 [Acacia pycnantha]|nr:hypothetical protein K1719_030412 [Acacia pycnantha]